MKWADVTDADLIGALNVVTHSHNPVAAKNLIEYFHERFSNEMPYNQDVLLAFLLHGSIFSRGRASTKPGAIHSHLT